MTPDPNNSLTRVPADPLATGGNVTLAQPHADENLTASQQAREVAEVHGMMLLARQFPRDTIQARTDLLSLCENGRFAEDGYWSYPRGKTTIHGPSVHLARAAAQAWGNIRFGKRILRDNGEIVLVEGFAWDLQTNAYVSDQAEFRVLVQRKQRFGVDPETGEEAFETRWVKPDERDKRELVNKHGAIAVRNCILQLIPRDVIDHAFETCIRTVKKGASQSREEQITSITMSFQALGVTKAHLERWLMVTRTPEGEPVEPTASHPLESINPDELSELRGIYKSVIDGAAKVADFFELTVKRPTAHGGTLDAASLLPGLGSENAGHQNAPKPTTGRDRFAEARDAAKRKPSHEPNK